MASFRPDDEICQLRSLLRHRETLISGAAREIQHMQKALHQMNCLLDKVVTDITGKTGLTIIERILAGERDPATLAALRDYRARASKAEIANALDGDYREEHVFVLHQAYEAYQFAQTQLQACDHKIEVWLTRTEKVVDVNDTPLPPSWHDRRTLQPNEPPRDTREHLYAIYGVDLTQVPGFRPSTIQTLLSEVGRDMTRWETEKHFTSWLGLAPNFKRSGGKDLSSHSRRVQSRAARTLTRSRNALGAFYRRLKGRLGPAKALTATAR
jgi:transposase